MLSEVITMQKTRLAATLGVILYAAALSASAAVPAERPNVIIIMADDLGYGDLGSYGHPIVKTPHLDTMAANGLRLTQYYAPAPLCSPSRAGLLTGRTPFRTGIRSWIPANKNVALGRNEQTIAHYLKAQGYDTAVVGKWHLNAGADRRDQPQAAEMGFNYSLVNAAGFVTSDLDRAPERPRYGVVYPNGFYRNGKPLGNVQRISGEFVSDEAVSWLAQKQPGDPFFLYVAFTEVHTPLASPQRYLDMYQPYISAFARQHPHLFYADWADTPYRGPGEYYANISYLDAQVGKILRQVERMGAQENTLILFTSDNGPVTREARKWYELNMAGETGGLRGRKDNLWEGGIRVPAIVQYRGHIPPGSVSDTPASGLDILPTLAELIGFPLSSDRVIDGESIASLLRGGTVDRRHPMIWAIDMPQQDDPTDMWALRQDEWKMIFDRQSQAKYLYNLQRDPWEIDNQLGKQPQLETRLQSALDDYRRSIEQDAVMRARGETPTPVDWN